MATIINKSQSIIGVGLATLEPGGRVSCAAAGVAMTEGKFADPLLEAWRRSGVILAVPDGGIIAYHSGAFEGLKGEAGFVGNGDREVIIPLARGSDGSLGVRVDIDPSRGATRGGIAVLKDELASRGKAFNRAAKGK